VPLGSTARKGAPTLLLKTHLVLLLDIVFMVLLGLTYAQLVHSEERLEGCKKLIAQSVSQVIFAQPEYLKFQLLALLDSIVQLEKMKEFRAQWEPTLINST